MKKLASWATIDVATQVALDAVPIIERAAVWEKRRKAVKVFKKAVQDHGAAIQEDRCVWCTLQVGEVGRRTPHPDHIAPKRPYGQWTFEARNIAISCEYCNGFAVKGALDTVAGIADDYKDVSFHLVHPYLDDVGEHIEFVGDDLAAGILVRGLSDKGRWTIREIKLDSTHLTTQRARDYLYAREFNKLPPHYQNLFKAATQRE